MLKKTARKLISLYQVWSHTRPSSCRFTPTCSAYADEAILLHGFFKGSFYAMRRLLKCRPLGPWGYDPPPAPKSIPKTVPKIMPKTMKSPSQQKVSQNV